MTTAERTTGATEPASTEAAAALGRRIRLLRTYRGLSLQQFAAESGLSIGLLSQLERGLSSPSLRTLDKLRQALGVSLGALFEDGVAEASSGVVRRAEDRPVLDLGPAGLMKQYLSPNRDASLQMMLLSIPPGGGSGKDLYNYVGEKAGMVLEGYLHLQVGNQAFDLRKGDSFQFDSSLPHGFRNRHTTRAEIFWIIRQPSPIESV